MFKPTRTVALSAAGALLAVPTAVLAAAPAHADVDRSGVCGTGSYDFSVDREGRGFEISADLDNVRPGTQWRIVLRQDGKRYTNVVRTADAEGDIEVDAFRGNTAGSDKFTMRAKQIGASASCSSTITVR